MIAFTGPVRQVETDPTKAVTIDPAPQAPAMAPIGGLWPAAESTAKPCPFCTTSTVIASGTTSSIIAGQENAGTYRLGGANCSAVAPGLYFSNARIKMIPTSMAPINGGS